MMKEESAVRFLVRILENISEEIYPETYSIVDSAMIEEERALLDSPYNIAENLMNADRECMMPQESADFIAEVLMEEICRGHYRAAEELGDLYYEGRTGTPDYAEAIKYYEIAERQGMEGAGERLGYCAYYGKGCEQDYEKAFNAFVTGAVNGRIRSLLALGDMYRDGKYVKRNTVTAYRIYNRCFHLLNEKTTPLYGAEVMIRMADCSFEGTGTAVNQMDALMFYQKAEQLCYLKAIDKKPVNEEDFKRAVARQDEVREKLKTVIPEFRWKDE